MRGRCVNAGAFHIFMIPTKITQRVLALSINITNQQDFEKFVHKSSSLAMDLNGRKNHVE